MDGKHLGAVKTEIKAVDAGTERLLDGEHSGRVTNRIEHLATTVDHVTERVKELPNVEINNDIVWLKSKATHLTWMLGVVLVATLAVVGKVIYLLSN